MNNNSENLTSAIWGAKNNEIDKYDERFLETINYLILDESWCDYDKEGKRQYKDIAIISKDELSALNISRIFISELYNIDPIINFLQGCGYRPLNPNKPTGYIWAPNWFGDSFTPSCYHLKNWQDNEPKYDFTPYSSGNWDYRYMLLASNLPITVKSVIDCGAGSMSLKGILNDTIAYYPIDNVRRSEETIVFDFDSGDSFPDIYADAAFLCGILEYIVCSDSFIKDLSQHVASVYLSYNTIDKFPDIQERLYKGWRNHFTIGDIIKLFRQNGFYLRNQIYSDRVESYLVFDKI